VPFGVGIVDENPWAPLLLGVSIAIAFLLTRCAFDGLFLAIWGFPAGSNPLWRSSIWWPEVVNATLLGYVPAALATARRGIDRDLDSLKPRLLSDKAEAGDIRGTATRPIGLAGRAFILCAFLSTVALLFVDPSVSGAAPSITNPTFMWPLIRIPIFIGFVCILIVSDLKATRAYLHLGRNLVDVELLDVQSLSPFARRGLRSSLMWMIFLIIFSLFWLGEGTAARQNPLVFVVLLTMAIVAFVVPLVGVHNNIRSVKHLELERLRGKIRVERAVVVDELADEERASPRLANLIAYYHLVERVREWPIDAANLLRFFVYLFVGLGSWLGGAVVERLLDNTLGG